MALTTNTLRLLQAVLISLQIINGGMAGLKADPAIALCVAAVVGGLQFYVHDAVGSDVVVSKKDGSDAC